MRLLPFNTSAFRNTLNSADRPAQRKALVSPFTDLFDGNPNNTLQYIALFTQRCVETGVTSDFDFIEQEHSPPSTVDLSDPVQAASWKNDPRRITKGNILIDASSATLEKMQDARDHIRSSLAKFTAPPDPVKSPVNAGYLVSFQNRQWIYVLLLNTWSSNMKLIMQRYQEQHDQDGVLLYYLFLQHFAGTTTENLIEAYTQLQDSKLQLSLYQGNVLNFTNAIRIPVRRLIKAKELPSIHHYISVFQGCMDAPNEEFRNFIFTLYADFRNNGPTKSLSMLQLLDKLDLEYNRINNLGRWIKREDPQVLALTANLQTLQSQFSTLQTQYSALMAKTSQPPPERLQKPPAHKPGDSEVIEFQGRTWKWCDKCFGGAWNRTHVTAEHVAGKGKRNRRRQSPTDSNTNNNTNNNSTPQANLASSPSPPSPPAVETTTTPPQPQANLTTPTSFSLDFI